MNNICPLITHHRHDWRISSCKCQNATCNELKERLLKQTSTQIPYHLECSEMCVVTLMKDVRCRQDLYALTRALGRVYTR